MMVLLIDTVGRIYNRQSNSERFWRKVSIGKIDECWDWSGRYCSDGYGRFDLWIGKDKYTSVIASRFAYIDSFGGIPDNLQVDHLCRNRLCCNPTHLETVTQQENIRRGEVHLVPARRAEKRFTCPQGHPYNSTNTYIRPKNPRGRECLICKNIGMKLAYLKRRERNGNLTPV